MFEEGTQYFNDFQKRTTTLLLNKLLLYTEWANSNLKLIVLKSFSEYNKDIVCEQWVIYVILHLKFTLVKLLLFPTFP